MLTSKPAAIHLATVVAVGSLLWSCVGYIPIWDGFIYASAINDAAQLAPSVASLRLAGHASHVYAAVAIAVQSLAPDRFWPSLALGALLVTLAVVAFHQLLAIAFPGPDVAVDRALLTATLAVQPTLLAAAVQPGLDLPLVPAFLWCTVLMLQGRRLPLVIVGIALAFTKETGVLLYAGLLASYGVWTLVRTTGPARTRLLATARLAPLAVPGVIFCIYLLVRRQLLPAGESVLWDAGTAMIGQSLIRQLLVPRIDRYLASYLSIVSVLNFAWVITLVVTVGVMAVVRRVGLRRLTAESLRFAASNVGFICLLALVTTFALTRFASYANSRYLLPVIALSLVPFFAALQSFRFNARMRRGVLAALPLMLIASNVRTVDPVSRAVYGTFAVGEHRMLRMTSITHECCGAGRDQLVYNLEFAELERVLSDALAGVASDDSSLIVLPDSTNWFVAPLLERSSNRRTLSRGGSYEPTVVESDSAAFYATRFPRATYVALPNGNAEQGLAVLAADFVVGPERRFTRGGYALSTYSLTARRP